MEPEVARAVNMATASVKNQEKSSCRCLLWAPTAGSDPPAAVNIVLACGP